jgi:hypothetical protein
MSAPISSSRASRRTPGIGWSRGRGSTRGKRTYTGAVATASDSRARRRAQVELAIRVLEPFLNVLLFVGERVSQVLERDDPDYVPARMPGEGGSAPRGLRERPRAQG